MGRYLTGKSQIYSVRVVQVLLTYLEALKEKKRLCFSLLLINNNYNQKSYMT